MNDDLRITPLFAQTNIGIAFYYSFLIELFILVIHSR